MAKIICTVTNDLTYDQRMIRICSSLTKAGYEVVLLGREKSQSQPLKDEVFQQKRLKSWFESGKLFYIEYNIRLFLYLALNPFDALCAIDLDTIGPAFLWARFRKKPLIYDAHEYFTEVPEVVDRPMVKAIWSGLARFVIPRLEYAYTVGPALAHIFTERYGTAFEVIRNFPVSDSRPGQEIRELPEKKEGDFILIYQGALNEGRGIETIFEALPRLPLSVKLWLVGEGDLSDFLRKLRISKHLQDRVYFLGYRHPDELRRITPQAHLGLNLLANKGLSYYYSLANKCFDYIQAGIPAIHMNFPEYQALQRDHPAFLLLPALEASALAALIRQLLHHPAQYQTLQVACEQAAPLLNWEIEEKKLIAFYEKVLANE
jgi:glycosyltransferase involved in cell wall biosynthesis